MQETPLALPVGDDFIVSHPGIMELVAASSPAAMVRCMIGHVPVKPLAASPLKGSIAHSIRRMRVRKSFIASRVAQAF
ncbi:conserved protein of unknown function [Pararobbsia alpina]